MHYGFTSLLIFLVNFEYPLDLPIRGHVVLGLILSLPRSGLHPKSEFLSSPRGREIEYTGSTLFGMVGKEWPPDSWFPFSDVEYDGRKLFGAAGEWKRSPDSRLSLSVVEYAGRRLSGIAGKGKRSPDSWFFPKHWEVGWKHVSVLGKEKHHSERFWGRDYTVFGLICGSISPRVSPSRRGELTGYGVVGVEEDSSEGLLSFTS